MSIITEALEKAQQEKEPAPSIKKAVYAAPLSRAKRVNNGKKIYAFLLGAAALSLLSIHLNSEKKEPASVNPPADLTVPAASVPEKKTFPDESFPDAQKASVKKIGATGETSAVTPRLNGIMYAPGAPKAVLDSRIVSEGEDMGSYKIIEISTSGVKILFEGKEIELKL